MYTKYNNVLSFYRSKGVIQKPIKSEQSSEKIRNPKNIPEAINLDEDKDFLQRFNKPWDVVTNKWEKTFTVRRDNLLAAKTLKGFLEDWPLLKNASYGPLLVSLNSSYFLWHIWPYQNKFNTIAILFHIRCISQKYFHLININRLHSHTLRTIKINYLVNCLWWIV